jgi:hypothetical protein
MKVRRDCEIQSSMRSGEQVPEGVAAVWSVLDACVELTAALLIDEEMELDAALVLEAALLLEAGLVLEAGLELEGAIDGDEPPVQAN